MSFTEDGVKINRKRGAFFSLLLFGVAELVLSVLFTAFLASTMIFPEQARAVTGVPTLISYQGRLTDQNGNPKNGTHYICYSVYDAQSGGAKLWPTGTPTATSTVVSNGVFNAPLGEMDSLASYDFLANDTEYLNVEVSSSAGTCGGAPFENLYPRQRLNAVPYARVAATSTNLSGGNVRVGDGGGASGKYLYLDVKNTADSIGDSCTTNGAMWYNSNTANATALVCNNGAIRLVGATSTIEAIQINAATPITSGKVVFTAGSGVSLGTAGQTVSINAQAPALAASNSTYTSGTVVLTGGNNVTVSYNGQTVSIAAAGGGPAIAVSNVASTFATGTVLFSGGNLVSIGTAAGPAIVVSNLLSSATTVSAVGTANAVGAMASRFALEGHVHAGVPVAGVSGGNTLNTSGTYYGSLMFAGGNNITLSAATGVGGQTITISAGAGGGGAAIQGSGTYSQNTGTVQFANSNGVTFGLSNNGVMTASVNAGGGGINGITAGTFSTNPSSLYFSDANGVSFGLNSGANSSVITASINAAGGGAPLISYQNVLGTRDISGFAFTGSHRSLFVMPLNMINGFPGDMTANTAYLNLSLSGSTATMSVAFTSNFYLGIYTLNTANSSLALLNSVNASFAKNPAATNNSTAFVGPRFLSIHSSQWSSQPVFKAGSLYWLGWFWSSAGALNQTASIFGNYKYSTAQRSNMIGTSGTATSQGWAPFYGVYTATTGAFPVALNNSQLNKVNAAAPFTPHVILNASAVTNF